MSVFSRIAIFNGRNSTGFVSGLNFGAGEVISQLLELPLVVPTQTRPLINLTSPYQFINFCQPSGITQGSLGTPFHSGQGFTTTGTNNDGSGQLFQFDTDDLSTTTFFAVIMKPS
jgi:hypothetical protein